MSAMATAETSMNGHATITAEQLGAVLGAMPLGAADTAYAAVSKAVTDPAFLARVKFARADVATERGQERRSATFEPMRFDCSQPPPMPDWLIEGVIERSTVNVLSGDTGAAKSIHMQDATVRILHGEPWLERATAAGLKVLYVDEENPERVTWSRLVALGLVNEDWPRLRYYRRAGISIGLPDTVGTRWLYEECELWRPDLVVIDTAASATTPKVNDNDEVAALYTATLRPLVEKFACAAWVALHERKPFAGETRNASMAAMGARQWIGQADTQMTLATHGDYTETLLEAGVETERAFTFSVPKGRDGISTVEERTVVRGVKMPRDGQTSGPWPLVSLRVDWEGRVPSKTDTQVRDSILRAMSAGDAPARWKRSEAAKAIGRESADGTFKRVWTAMGEGAKPLLDMQGSTSARTGTLTERGRELAATLGLEA